MTGVQTCALPICVIIDREKTGNIPIINHYVAGPVRFEAIYLLEDYSQEIANRHVVRSWGGVDLSYPQLKTWAQEILGDSWKTASELTGLRAKPSEGTGGVGGDTDEGAAD